MEALETITQDGLTAELFQDIEPFNPRTEYDNFATMYCEHRRYDLGDKNADDPRELDENSIIGLPLYLYDHSGITMNTGGFNCPWDSGQVGFIYVTKAAIRAEFGVKRIGPKLRERVLTMLRGEVETYDQYLTGQVYGFSIEKDGEHLDGCWGLFGYDYAAQEMKDTLATCIEYEKKRRFETLKTLIRNHVPLNMRAEILAI
jgi:hypothetical protein